MSRLALGRTGLKLVAVGMFALGLPITGLTVTATVAQAASSTTSAPKLSVVSALNSLAGGAGAPKGGDAVTTYKWILQEDPTVDGHSTPYSYPQTNNPESLPLGQQPTAANPDLCHPIIPAGYPSPYPNGNPSYPQGCNWPSVNTAHNAPIVTQGDNSDWGLAQIISGVGPTDVAGHVCGTTGYDPTDCAAAGWTPADGVPTRISKPLPAGNYIVSVMADGYEIGGTRFQIPFVSTDDTLRVKLNPGPLPLGTLQVLAFDDMAPTGGAYAAETESGLTGFKPQLTDFTDQLTQDYYGYPLCTTYKTDPAGKIILDQYGRPTPDQLGGPDGQCVTGSDGIVKIPNLASGRYGVSLVPPDSSWKQTTTLEGAHDFDVWLQANDNGLDTELVLAGEPVPFVQFGYAKMGDCSDPLALATDANGNGLPVPYVFAQGDFQPGECLPGTPPFLSPTHSGEITGRLMAEEPYVPGVGGLAGQAAANGQAGLRVDRPITDGLIALADLNDGDRTKLVINANTDGTYDIKGVPDGSYNMSIWDYNQDYAFDAFQVEVHGKVVSRNFTAGAARTVAAGTVRNGANGIIPASALNRLSSLPLTLPAVTAATAVCTFTIGPLCFISTATVTFASNPGVASGTALTFAGFSPNAWNGSHTVNTAAGNTITFLALGPLANATTLGTVTASPLTFSASDVARTITSSTTAIPAGTRVTAFNAARNGGTWTHSGTNFTRTAGITFVATDIGSVITGTGIPTGTYVVSVTNPNTVVLSQAPSAASGTSFSLNASITLSQNGTASSGFAFQLGSGAQTVAGSNLLTISGSFAFAAGDVGSTVDNANVPVGVLLAAPTPVVGKTYQATMSNSATTTANGAALTLGRGAATVAGSSVLTVAANMPGFTGFTATDVGAFVTVGNVASGTTITAFIDAHHVQLSAAATATGSNLSFSLSTVTPSVLALGDTPLLGWFTRIEGHVFVDKNANGKMDPGEEGIPDFTMQLLNRTNQQYEQGQNVAGTDDSGAYSFNEGYPLGQYNVLQFFNTRFKTTGVTCQADNDPQEHTLITPAVDLSVNPIIGLNGRCDIGVQPYSTNPADNDNGGIVSTVTYQSYRTVLTNEQNVNNAYDVGIPDYNLDITQPVACTSATPADLCKNGFQLDPANSGQYLKHPYSDALLAANPDVNQTYLSEHYNVPPSCTPRMADGSILDYNFQEAVQPGGACVESALFGTNFGFGSDNLPLQPNRTNPSDPCYEDPAYITPGGQYASRTIVDPSAPDYGKVRVAPALDAVNCVLHGVQTVDGNYGFATPGPGDYLVHVDMYTPAMVDMYGKPKYKVDTEANVNQYDGPMWVPQGGDYSGVTFGQAYNTGNPTPGKGLEENPNTQANAPHAECAGPEYTVNNTNPAGPNYVSNPSYLAANPNGGPFEGSVRNRCDTILVHAQNGQSVAPNFFFYTDVPLATIFSGYATDDISVATNKKGTDLGEVQGIPNLPIGLYDWTGRQVDEVDSDPNGIWQFITPSMNTFNCSSPSGACPDVYRFIGNDPGQPAAPNLNYNPQYRTISADFQAWPNNLQPADVAPFKVAVSFEGNGSQFNTSVVCATKLQEPTFYTISRPYLKSTDFSTYRSFAPTTTSGASGVTRTGVSKLSSSSNAGAAVLNAAVIGSRITGTNIPANTTVLSKTAGKLAINASRTGGSNVLTTAANFFTASDVNSVYLGAGFGGGVVRVTSVTDARHAVMSSNATSTNGNFGFALEPYVTLSNNETGNSTGIAFTLTTPSASTTNGSTTFTVAAAAAFTFTAGDVGSLLIAPGVPANTTIAGFTDSKHVTLSNAATATGAFFAFTVVSPTANTTFTINGLGFGATAGTLELDGVDAGLPAATTLPPATWSDTQITFNPPGILMASPGQYQLVIRDPAGHQATGTVTFHVLGGSYNPTVLEVGPGKQFDPNGFHVDVTGGSTTATVHGVLTLPQPLEAGTVEGNVPGDFDFPLPLGPVALTGAGVPDGATLTVDAINPDRTTTVTLSFTPSASGSVLYQIGVPGDALVKGPVQRALEEAASHYVSTLNFDATGDTFLGETVTKRDPVLLVIYPNIDPATGLSTTAWTPLSAYFENIIIHSPVRIQGVGPGGMYKDSAGVTHVTPGANIDGRFFNANSANAESILDYLPGAEPWAYDWTQLQSGIFHSNQNLYVEGEVVYIVGRPGLYAGPSTQFPTAITPALDGLGISGGDQKAFPGNINEINGAKTALPPDETNFIRMQGGGITLLADDANWRIGNNLIQWNSGTYAGAIRSGSPQLAADIAQVAGDGGINTAPSRNTNLDIHDNRIFANGGTNLAGAVGIFAGTNSYHIEHNAFCGNLSAEYGGAISQYGLSPNGEIDHNKIMLNQSIDEGGGIMIAGEPPLDLNTSTPLPNRLSAGAGAESIHDNYIAANLAQDDGGGLRFLSAGNFAMNVFNNMITNNMSAHEGGGIAIDDAPNVRLYNDTIAKNITTATAVTSTGLPAPAGVSTTQNSAQLMACRTGQPNLTTACNGQPPQPSTAPSYSNPLLFNDVFYDNRAGSWDGVHSTVVGIGLPGDATPHHVWNIGDADSALVALSPTNSVIGPAGDASNIVASPTNATGTDPQFVAAYDTIVSVNPWRIQPRFRPASLVTETLPPDAIGDYHVNAASPVVARGAANKSAAPFTPSPAVAPARDIDADLRTGHIDSGADQVKPGVNANNGSGNVYVISGDVITPLGGQVMSDPSISPVQFGTAGAANAAGNTAVVVLPGRPLNTKTALVGGKLQLTPTLAAAANSLVIEGIKPATGPLVVDGAQMPGAIHGVANVKVSQQIRGAPPLTVTPIRTSSTTSSWALTIGTMAGAGLLLLLTRMRRRRLTTIASTDIGGHDVLS